MKHMLQSTFAVCRWIYIDELSNSCTSGNFQFCFQYSEGYLEFIVLIKL